MLFFSLPDIVDPWTFGKLPIQSSASATMARALSFSVFGLVLCCLLASTSSLPTVVPGLDAAVGPAVPRQSLDLAAVVPELFDTRATQGAADAAPSDLAGYLTIVFLGADPYIYFYLSDGNNPVAYKALNKGNPIIKPTKGTGGVRDPAIVKAGGDEAGLKWYIVGTDLDIGKTNWGASQRTGSRGIFVWESTDLLTWTNERLVTVEDATAGMVWAPEAIWDPAKSQYMVYWSSKFVSLFLPPALNISLGMVALH